MTGSARRRSRGGTPRNIDGPGRGALALALLGLLIGLSIGFARTAWAQSGAPPDPRHQSVLERRDYTTDEDGYESMKVYSSGVVREWSR
jgi:hypothetical protein